MPSLSARRPKNGRGGGSFANDAGNSYDCNARFVELSNEKVVGVQRTGEFQTLTRVFLVAKTHISAEKEIFVSYGKGYWRSSLKRGCVCFSLSLSLYLCSYVVCFIPPPPSFFPRARGSCVGEHRYI